MERRILNREMIADFAAFLHREEKSPSTCEKYLRDVENFRRYVAGGDVCKEQAMQWKQHLQEAGYAIRSINSMLASVNSLFDFLGWRDCRVKTLRLQRQLYCAEEKELSKGDYLRLLECSKRNEQLNLVMQTICGTGIRVSELKYFTVKAVHRGVITVNCKNKTRTIMVPGKLRKLLINYAKRMKISAGEIFRNRKGKPLDRSSIWRRMKRLCVAAGLKATKVFPHNLRKLFARTFYSIEKDIAQLADVLGHSSINTTRIYIMTSGNEHRKKIERLGLVIYENAT